MKVFRNRKSGQTFEVDESRAPLFAGRPAHYAAVHRCPDCDREFDSTQGLAAHSRTHDGGE